MMRADLHPVTEAECVFVIGLRRSGTSFTRQCLNRAGCRLLYEPRDLWWAITQGHLPRFRACVSTRAPIAAFLAELGKHGSRYGAKFALEPGISAMYWQYIPPQFPNAKYVFVVRNVIDNYASYVREDQWEPQGIVSESVFRETHSELVLTYCDFLCANPGRCAIVDYDLMIESGSLPAEVGTLLGIENLDVREFVRNPRHMTGAPSAPLRGPAGSVSSGPRGGI